MYYSYFTKNNRKCIYIFSIKKNERILFVEIGFKLKIKLFHLYITVFTKLHREEINIWGWTGLFKGDNATIQAFN